MNSEYRDAHASCILQRGELQDLMVLCSILLTDQHTKLWLKLLEKMDNVQVRAKDC
jgi:hypothetical protein